jgi:cyclase
MQVQRIESDIWMFRGSDLEAVSTVFVHGKHALLVDALANVDEAGWIRRHVEQSLGATVRMIVMTHYMSDHMAGLHLFPAADVLAHRHFMQTYLSQKQRSAADDTLFVTPTIEFSDTLSFRWGRHRLHLFHNPGKTMSDTVVDVPDCDLVLCGDALVGNIAYIGSAAPSQIDTALCRLQELGRSRVIPGHIGLLDGHAFAHARQYLRRLREHAVKDSPEALRLLPVEACLADGVVPCAFEREWHARNLDVVVERRVFAVPLPTTEPAPNFPPLEMESP